MDIKENDAKTKFIKESDEDTEHYVLQKNKKTKLGTGIIIAFLLVLIVGIVVSGILFDS
ncbi:MULTISPECIES: hypothetical protein [Cellulophaga]|jgi:hypothetical protein|uniref:Uncharacterized protein n=1 Tax=Cellulophaga baltica TaxID=76594 RepID=A0A1G7DDX3_9FLAO|nr:MULTISPECIES: hypothetical protein [Cellulophaga]MCR1023452.1 hypothetical protein [Cellulophaga baltica]QXP51360.1 hypothetical protein H0I24_14570 [Cellulophaga sp. HaHa_2_1]QXP56314.1 hypothetical protein H0I25_00550 [Cellulophaga sp. HaHa_2_95]SDE49200.1 hypothetical protein SAMN04487992_101479 [Cellulophaga baltica]